MTTPAKEAELLPLPLPDGVSENYVHCPTNGLTFHILEAGYTPQKNRPLVILCHGYPELAFSWRKIMPAIAKAGFYVVSFDQRGYGRTTGWDTSPFAETDLYQFSLSSVVRDVVTLVHALGYREVKCIVGHDFGAVTSSMSALMRPDLFKSVVMMSHPFKAPAALPFDIVHGDGMVPPPPIDIQAELAKLPEPRKHYKWYNSTATAGSDWSSPAQGLHAFLRGYLHVKSADWKQNKPHALEGWNAEQLAEMPHYYILPLDRTMPEAIADMMATEDASATKRWMSDADLDVYVQEWSRTGFQGGLNFYRTTTNPARLKDLELFAGKKIECPSTFISGRQDWGNYQQPGAIEAYPESCSDFRGIKFIDGAGHWPQQEQPEKVSEAILEFLRAL
ncbi:Alpha/Beta hydrolase protein [Paraphoma chrysanthemicola]|nr:Alpha/Beta hydrolase protein [Paraphoma chrysanthemicola]